MYVREKDRSICSLHQQSACLSRAAARHAAGTDASWQCLIWCFAPAATVDAGSECPRQQAHLLEPQPFGPQQLSHMRLLCRPGHHHHLRGHCHCSSHLHRHHRLDALQQWTRSSLPSSSAPPAAASAPSAAPEEGFGAWPGARWGCNAWQCTM